MNTTCNSTLEELRIGSETKIAGPFTFHNLALIIGGGCAAIAILTSFYLMWRHATNYTKPREQKHIIRILFMVPIYSASAFLCIWYYWHAVYFQVISDCYEAFAISSFFALMCHYMGPDLHEQKDYFRNMRPVKPWVMPLNWFAKCCGGDRGPWRTPKSGLTWFNIMWIGIYHYCFIRVAMTITAVVTQYFDRYCESSDSIVFAHIWVLVIESLAVTVAMYCVIQFYVQLKEPLNEHKPFLKVLAIKLVIFLSFWQSSAISVGTSTLHLVEASATLAYPDLKVGIPSLLLCVEMSLFSILHLWAFPYAPYVPGAKQSFYPVADPALGLPARENEHGAPQGGTMGIKAFIDAINLWDVVKAFARGLRWLFVGVKNRHSDPSYTKNTNRNSLDTSYPLKPFGLNAGLRSTDHLPIATQFRSSTFYSGGKDSPLGPGRSGRRNDESAGLINNAQEISRSSLKQPSPYVEEPGREPGPHIEEQPTREPSPYIEEPRMAPAPYYEEPMREPSLYRETPLENPRKDGRASSPYHDPHRGEYYQGPPTPEPPAAYSPYQAYSEADRDNSNMGYSASQGVGSSSGSRRQNPRSSTQLKVGNALWGDRTPAGGQR